MSTHWIRHARFNVCRKMVDVVNSVWANMVLVVPSSTYCGRSNHPTCRNEAQASSGSTDVQPSFIAVCNPQPSVSLAFLSV